MQKESVFGTQSIIFFVAAALLAAALLNQVTSFVLSVLDNDFTKGISTSAIAIFLGNFLLQKNQRQREEDKAVSGIVLNFSRIAKKLHRIGRNIAASNKLIINQDATLSRETRRIVSKLCHEIIEHAQEARMLARDINSSGKWYHFSKHIDEVADKIATIMERGFASDIYDESYGEIRTEWTVILFVEIIYPLEMELYKTLIQSKEYIDQGYWEKLSEEIGERIQDREFQNWIFSERLNPQAAFQNSSPEYVLPKMNKLREEVSIALKEISLSDIKKG